VISSTEFGVGEEGYKNKFRGTQYCHSQF